MKDGKVQISEERFMKYLKLEESFDNLLAKRLDEVKKSHEEHMDKLERKIDELVDIRDENLLNLVDRIIRALKDPTCLYALKSDDHVVFSKIRDKFNSMVGEDRVRFVRLRSLWEILKIKYGSK